MSCSTTRPSSRRIIRIGLSAAAVCVLLLFPLDRPHSARADEALDNYNLATGLYKQKRWDQAADSFRAFVKKHPRHVKVPLARLYLGLTLVHQKSYDGARTVLRGFVKDYPRSKYRPDAMYRVGECSYFLSDLKAAETEFAAFLKAYPKNDLAEWALPYLADAQRRADKPREAAATYQQALKRFPKSRFAAESTFGLARSYEALKQPDAAIATYQKVAGEKGSPLAPDAQFALATVQFDAGRFAAAAGSYEQFIQQFPQSKLLPEAEINAGYAHYQAGDFRRAVDHFEKAGQQPEQAVTAGYWKGVSRKALGQHAEAAQDLETAFKADENGPLAATALFQWADVEFQRRRFEAARGLFLDVVQRWPQGDMADDGLYWAAESALSEGKLDEGEQLVARFDKEQAQSPLRMHVRILDGRLAAARGGEDNLKKAVDRFRKVLAESKAPRSQLLARFHLVRTLQLLGDDRGVLDAVGPLVKEIETSGAASDFVDALIVAGGSQLALNEHKEAEASTSLYLKLQPEGSQAAQALATRAIARAHLEKKEESLADLEKLSSADSNGMIAEQAAYKMAEIAYDKKDWDWSAGLYERLVARGPDSPRHPQALSGLSWCRFEQKKYLDAAEQFGRLVKQHPDEPILAPEAAFKRAESLENAGELPEAAAAYGSAFEQFAPRQPPAAGAEQKPPLEYAFLSGLNQARVLRSLKKVQEADAAYEQLLARFPQPAALDKRLDEWALLNYDAGNYKRSDELFARLVKERPDSDLVDNARLSLAESDLLAGRRDAARAAFDKLQAETKSDAQVQEVALHHLVGMAVEAEQWQDVGRIAADLVKRFPESKYAPHAEFQAAHASLNQKQDKQAQAALLALKPRFAKAAPDEELWIPQIWIMLAETYFREKKYDEVVQVVEELRQRSPKCPVLYQADEVLGRSYKNLARFDEARTAFRRAIADPNARRTETAAKAQFLLAETFLIQKDYKNAQTEHFKVYHLYKFPEWQSASLYQAALCDEALKRWADAARLYGELLEKFPQSEFAAKAKVRLPLARKNAGG